MQNASRRFVRVTAPSIHAGIGNALREAFSSNQQARSLAPFHDLLAQLD